MSIPRRRLPHGFVICLLIVLSGATANTAAAQTITPTSDAPTLASAIVADPSVLANPDTSLLSGTPLNPGFLANATSDKALAGFPTAGTSYVILTSGDPELADDTPQDTDEGSGRDNQDVDPSSPDSTDGSHFRGDTDFDVSLLRLDVTVPPGANCLALDYRFLSEEFPEFVGSSFNDAFIAEIDTSNWTTSGSVLSAPNDFATDTSEEGVTVNGVGPVAVSSAESADTTYDAATGLVTTKKPITPGAHAIYLSILDQGDQVLDSAAFVDNLRFLTEDASTCRPPFVAEVVPPPPPPPGAPPPPPPPPPPPSNTFTVGSRIVFKNGSSVIVVNVPGPGTVTAGQASTASAGAAQRRRRRARPLIKSARKVATKAGPVRLTIKPTKAGKKVLRRKRKFTVRVKITFRPTGGTARSVTKRVTIKVKRRRR